MNYRQDNWDEHLAAAEFACNNAKQTSTKISLFFTNTGQNPNVPLRFLNESSEEDKVQSTEDFVKQISDIIKEMTLKLEKAQSQQKMQADKH